MGDLRSSTATRSGGKEDAMRKQYHFRDGPSGLQAWDVDTLIELSSGLPIIDLPLVEVRELDEAYWFSHGAAPTCQAIAGHAALIAEASLDYPIVLSADGRVMDGMHRVVKAAMLGLTAIKARKLAVDPPPDYVGVAPDDLPY